MAPRAHPQHHPRYRCADRRGLTLVAIVFGLGFAGNPMFWPYDVGGAFFDLILLGYGLPAVLTAALALNTRGTRPLAYSAVRRGDRRRARARLSLAASRRIYHGPVLTMA